jgi:flavodoxin
VLFVAAVLYACTAEVLPEQPVNDQPVIEQPTSGTELVSVNIRLASPATRAVIQDSGSGAASFSWENGDEIGVVVNDKYHRFTLSGKDGDDTGIFSAELPAGSVIADGAHVAYPYIAEDYDENAHNFSLTYPTEYTSTKDGDFRHRWAGTLVKDGSNYQAVLSHQTAILRVTYENVPSEATAVRLTADQNLAGNSKTITTNLSWHAATMNYYFPVPAGTYNSFTIQLLNGSETIGGTQKSMSNGAMVLETGKIYRTPSVSLGPKKILVAYFSFTNTTKGIAESMASILGADLYQITPAEAYTSDNSNYYDESTRAYQEQYGPASARPEINTSLSNTDYDIVLIGFPIWYGKVPRVILSFLDAYDFSGKTVIPFCTSGSSGISASQTELQNTYPDIKWKTGARLNSYTEDQLKTWLTGLGIQNASFQLIIEDTIFAAELANNATAQAFNSLLPMNLDMSELNGNEKYHYLDTALPTNAACPGTIHNGDILLYGNNCVVVFYKTFTTNYKYTKIGRIVDPSTLANAVGSSSVSIQFEQ